MPVLNRPQQLSRGAIPNNNSAPLNTSTEQRLAALIARTGYKIIQENGQRKYFLPNYTGPKPAKGCEIFVGKLPRDLLEDEIVPIFEEMGTIIEVRLMVEFSGLNRGYCFVLYQTVEAAQKAVRELDNYEIRKGKYVGVVRSVDNRRLFIGGIPRNKTREEVLDEVSKLVEGVVNVILYPSAGNKEKNRGFAFIEFLAHRDAAMARRKLIPGRAQLWNSNIAVDWAEPEQEVDESTMSTVKIVYLRNLMITTTEERLREIFEAWKPGCIERVKKLKDYAFVHFFQRSDAMDAISAMNGREIDGATVEACLAKPPDKSLMKFVKSAQKLAPVLGAPGNIHQNLVAAATQLYRQNIHGNHTMLPNMGPVGLPDIYNGELPAGFGANGFEFSAFGNHGNFAGRQVRSAAGLQSAGVRQAVAAMVRDALNPKPGKRYSEAAIQFPPMDMQPAPIAFIPVPTAGPLNLLTQKPVKSFVELLDLYCKYLRWGEPQYELHSVAAKDVSGQNVNAYVYKVMIPGFLQVGSFQDTKPSTSVEEAKELAAQYTMLRLGIPLTSEEDIRAVLYQEMMADAAASNAVRLFPFASDDRIHAQECLSGFYSQQQERDQYDWLRSAERYENCHMSSLHQRQLIYDRAPNAYTAAAYTEISTQSSFKVPPQAKHYSPYSNYNLDVSCGSLSSGFGSLASTGNGSSGFSSLTSSPVGASAPSQSLSGQFYEERMHAGGSGFSKGHAEGVTGCRYPGINLPNSNGTTHLHHSLNKNDVSFEKNQAIMQLIHRLAALNTGHSLAGAGNNKATATSSNAVLAAPMAGEMFVSAAGPATVGPGANMISGGQAVCPQFGFIPQYYQPTVWTQGMMNIPTSGPAVQPKVSAPNGVPAADGAVNLPVTVGQPGTAYAEPANATTAIVVSSN